MIHHKDNKYKKILKELKQKKFIEDKKANSLSYFYKGNQIENIINKDFINKLCFIVSYNKKNLRINLHSSNLAKYHDMIIFQRKNTYIKPHKHLSGGETIHIIKGKLEVILFDKVGKIKAKKLMDNKNNFIYRIPHFYYHTYKILSNIAVYHEDKKGPFIKNKPGTTIFAPWV